MSHEVLERIRKLILLAMGGELSLDKLYSTWPADVEGDPLAEAIYDDVESAVEHYPDDHTQLLMLDLELLGRDEDSKDLLELRHQYLRT